MKRSPSFSRATATLLAAMSLAAASSLSAETYYWNNLAPATFAWSDGANWSLDPVSGGVTGTAPLSTDNVVFNQSDVNGTLATLLTANTAVNGITFSNTSLTSVIGSGGNRFLTIGSGGITLATGTGGGYIGDSGSGKNVIVVLGSSQTWTNNSSSSLTIRNRTEGLATGANPVTLTMAATGTGAITNSGQLNDGAGGAVVSLVIASTGSGVASSSGGNYSGGTTIKSGIFSVGTNSLGASTGDVRIGDTSGTYDAQLRITGSQTLANKFIIQAGNSGTMSISFASGTTAPTPTFTGDFVLNKDLLLGSLSTNNIAPSITISGDISGDGGLVLNRIATGTRDASLTLSGTNSYRGNTTITRSTSTFTLDEAGALTFYIGNNGVANSISGAGTAIFNGTFNFDLSNASLTEGNSWTLVNVATLTESFTGTFNITGFTDADADNIWTNGNGFSFNEATGILSYTGALIPEPSTYALLAGGAGLMLVAGRRRRVE